MKNRTQTPEQFPTTKLQAIVAKVALMQVAMIECADTKQVNQLAHMFHMWRKAMRTAVLSKSRPELTELSRQADEVLVLKDGTTIKFVPRDMSDAGKLLDKVQFFADTPKPPETNASPKEGQPLSDLLPSS